ncbi:MAG: hypothetical protein E7369_01940 [Clostridiales bacterium]|nr:hypothetical protein [Clostridiales bacterium]
MNGFIQKHKTLLTYILLGVSVVMALALVIWAIAGGGDELIIKEGSLSFSDGVRTEYVMGEDIGDTSGITMTCDGKMVTHLSYDYDFSTAGTKKVQVSYSPQKNLTYIDEYVVEVFYVKAITFTSELKGLKDIILDEKGNPIPREISVVATLSKPSTEFTAYDSTKNMVLLTKDNCKITHSFDGSTNLYKTEVSCGVHTKTVYQAVLGESGKAFIYEGNTNWFEKLSFATNQDGDSLDLYVTQKEGWAFDSVGAEGYYLYKQGENVSMLPFAYYVNGNDGYKYTFNSSTLTGNQAYNLTESVSAKGKLTVKINGKDFTTDYAEWTSKFNEFEDAIYFGGNELSNGSLYLIVTGQETIRVDGETGATGYYVYTDVSGVQTSYNFKYNLSVPAEFDGVAGTCSNFVTDGLTESLVENYDLSVSVNGETFKVENSVWEKAVINLDSDNKFMLENSDPNDGATLALYVYPEKNQWDGETGAYGYYVYTNGDTVKVLNFAYYLDGNWQSHFVSSSFNEGLVDSESGDMSVTYDGKTFTAKYETWTAYIIEGLL